MRKTKSGEGHAPNLKLEATIVAGQAPVGWVEVKLRPGSVADLRRLSLHVDPSACWWVDRLGVLLPMGGPRADEADGMRWVRAMVEETNGDGAYVPRAVVPAWSAYEQSMITGDDFERAVAHRSGE